MSSPPEAADTLAVITSNAHVHWKVLAHPAPNPSPFLLTGSLEAGLIIIYILQKRKLKL